MIEFYLVMSVAAFAFNLKSSIDHPEVVVNFESLNVCLGLAVIWPLYLVQLVMTAYNQEKK